MARLTRKPKDPNGRHIRVYATLLDTPAWRCLGWSARALFVDLRTSLNGTNNGNISATLSVLKHRGWASSKTLASALYELRALGFLVVTREGGLKQGTRVPTLYRFTDLEVFEFPKVGVQATTATHDYAHFKNLADAQQALRDGIDRLRAEGRKKQLRKENPPVPIVNRIASAREPLEASIASERKQGERASVPKGNRGIRQ